MTVSGPTFPARPSTRPRTRRAWSGLPLALLLCLLMPLSAQAWWSQEWSYRKSITVDTAALPAGSAALSDVPLLVRLHDGVIRFSDLAADGADLRFVAEDDKTPLRFHLERFDPVFNLAFAWVSLPRVEPGKPLRLWLYYGNATATAAGDARGSYDAQQVLTYHFGETSGPPADSTSYANAATTAVGIEEGGFIGASARFDGRSSLVLPASPSLAWTAGGAMTWSAWVNPATAAQESVLYSRRDGPRSLRIGLSAGIPYVAVTDEQGREQRAAATAALPPERWHHVALTAAEAMQLYVDGTAAARLDARLPAMATAARVGAQDGDGAAAAPFVGGLDELQLANVARAPGWLRLAATHQAGEPAGLAFGADEQLSTWSSGYMAIILRSVTLDGWIVIVLCGVMAVVSWGVMIGKARDLSRVTRANAAFDGWYRTAADELAQLGSGAPASATTGPGPGEVSRSPLYQMYLTGLDEVRRRVAGPAGRPPDGLSAQAIEAIRARLDADVVHETQRLNQRMVLLTIAISGGPFLGLLGTVIGVMITFAAIAAAGDVNVNAIAPGISAALVATVAGLLVAIPALFGYNYLLARIKDVSAQMRVFLDAFVARIAESQQGAAGRPAGS